MWSKFDSTDVNTILHLDLENRVIGYKLFCWVIFFQFLISKCGKIIIILKIATEYLVLHYNGISYSLLDICVYKTLCTNVYNLPEQFIITIVVIFSNSALHNDYNLHLK